MTDIGRLKRLLKPLSRTPFHPQWFVFRDSRSKDQVVNQYASGVVLDIGCADGYAAGLVGDNCKYIGIDYLYTATSMYMTRPEVFADAQELPIKSESIDTVLLLDVLEHLPRPAACLQEIRRVLKENGKLIIQVPFLYPIHDAPFDYCRWTEYGLAELCKQNKMKSVITVQVGKPLETSALLMNIGLCKLISNWFNRKSVFSILVLFLPPTILFINIFCYLLAFFSSDDPFMSHSYRSVWQKK